MAEFKYEITREIEVLSRTESPRGNTYSKEINMVSYNDADPVYDIRNWTETAAGERRMGKGVTLNRDELLMLRDALNRILTD